MKLRLRLSTYFTVSVAAVSLGNFIFNSFHNPGLGIAYYWGEMWTPLFAFEVAAVTGLLEYLRRSRGEGLTDATGLNDYVVLFLSPLVMLFYSTGMIFLPTSVTKVVIGLIGRAYFFYTWVPIFLTVFGLGTYSIYRVFDEENTRIKIVFGILNLGVIALIGILLFIAAAYAGT